MVKQYTAETRASFEKEKKMVRSLKDHDGIVQCHGDMKPENILFVNGQFKLRDPAEACIEVSTSTHDPQSMMKGGTTTYDKEILVANVDMRTDAGGVVKILDDKIYWKRAVNDEISAEVEEFLQYLDEEQTSSQVPIRTNFKSTEQLISQPVAPTVQRSRQRLPRTSGSRSQSLRHDITRLTTTQTQQDPDHWLQRFSIIGDILPTEHRGVIDMWMVEAELNELDKSPRVSRLSPD
ncbi:uncharacterized protein BCR38DRAFT_504318 [Pseudomassariella vexata]|uniref:Protein kinase domain-containing protein n=1 Tax=Pseudomassariella vexata TaxID=1141098 RepID=A0A1Y2DDN3_9PEZI|nr:uncharacterized protein BCR38DRAFT_504318 [Pseudomassariella vexata]ORY57214.1 hypothetical protein BCR38DRAFT_504318 [Pseudomassariella vexata]